MINRFFPFLNWFRNYNFAVLRTDLLAGITVAMVLIPQSMAYAQLAGLPAYYGLYASFLPPIFASLFGSSRQLATGPVAVVSLLTSVSLENVAIAGSEGYITYAILLALLVGLFQFALGIFKLGLVVNFISHPVVNGFTNAAAIIIASSQLSKIFGVYVDRADYHFTMILRTINAAVHFTHWPTLLMGAAAFAIMYGLKRISPKIPYVLVAVVLTTYISWAIGFERNVTVDISAIKSPNVRELLKNFNKAVESISTLSERRTEFIRSLESAKKTDDQLATLDAKYRSELLALKIERHKFEAYLYRMELRKIFFKGLKHNDGSLIFIPLGEFEDTGDRKDGRIWRLQVDNQPFKKNQLVMVGGGAVVGQIPKGLPAWSIPRFDLGILMQLLPYVVIISVLGFMEAVSIAKAMAARTGQRLDPNQELIGQGLANIFGALTQSYPTAGSFSRSAVNLQSGAVSGFSNVFTSVAVVIVLFFFTPLLYHLPQSVLAAVIMMAVISLLNLSGFIHAWRAQWYDGIISILTFVFTLGFAPHLDKGIMVGVVLSLIAFLYKSMRPTVVDLSLGMDKTLHDSVTFGLKECKYIGVVRFDGPLFFANASYLEDQIRNRRISKKELKHIIIASNGINDIDASGEEALSLIVDRVRSAGIDISLSGVNEAVMRVLKRTHLLAKIGEDHVYPKMEAAINAVHELTHRGGQEENCPLRTVVHSHLSY